MNARCLELAEKLANERTKTIDFFKSISDGDREKLIYADGMEWKVKDILAHFVASEISITELIKRILEGGEGTPPDFDLDRFNQRKVANLQSSAFDTLIEDFVEARGDTIRLVGTMVDLDLQRTGRHPWLGDAPLEDILKLMYRHNQIHQRDVRKSLLTK